MAKMTPMPNPLLLLKLFDLGSDLITDKDKKAEFEVRAKEIANELDETLLNTTTTAWADGIVKILLATKVYLRPLGSLLLTAAGAYMHIEGVELHSGLHAVFDGAFPAWMYSRHSLARNGADKIKGT